MNIKQANNLDFRDLLSKLGYEPARVTKGGRDIWYYSPFRKETEPSFHIREGREYDWIWYDFGHDGTSTILDFIMQYKGTDKRGALAFLDTLYPNYKSYGTNKAFRDPNQKSFLFPSQDMAIQGVLNNKKEQDRNFEFIEELPLKSEAIFKYLESRKIPRRIASKYFRVLKYRNKEDPISKSYFGFGIPNESKGWEVRSASDKRGEKFKTALIAKDISIIKGSEKNRGDVSVFEGMMDFASLLTLYATDSLNGDAIILHGLKLYGRANQVIKEHGYTRIHTFLDNNKSGQETTKKFIADLGDIVENHSPSFSPYTDLNDALKDGFKPIFDVRPLFPRPC